MTTRINAKRMTLAVFPLIALALLLYLFTVSGGNLFTSNPTNVPIENLVIERIELPSEHEIVLHVLNAGPKEVTVAQIMVNEAMWEGYMSPSNTLSRLERGKVVIPFAWVELEPYEVTLITSNSIKFSAGVEAAVLTPSIGASQLWSLGLIGLYVGVIPVFLGTIWFPFLNRLSTKWYAFLLSFTVGLLIFLGVSTVSEAVELTGNVPGPFQGVGLLLIALAVSFLGLMAASGKGLFRNAGVSNGSGLLFLAYVIALGIGLHNLGEGLAIGAAYAVGKIALGAFLIIGFTIHNTTEGIAIIAPVTSGKRPAIYHFVLLGLLGGAPTILGAWLGGFGATAIWAILFLSIGAGAIFQVVYAIIPYIGEGRNTVEVLSKPLNLLGLLLGFLLLYLTGLLVPA